ncbi:membrane protein insertase YidC [Actinokineospora spheciospongiae]|uniref:membrane protein insertase YidC n=1 Tax=Actinokineospora spheciospongiae TaxID=909613 RepID=UPI000D71A9AE|nr:membrane protein insertase YidC [Actinokineospora spheciospongiae]PWW62755.1 YidC/Oxa1 family membrane protein insertase [Actinokineospora spheciospongiae]
MFDVFLYPVSGVLWFWHRLFGALFGPGSGAAWVLAIVFLVFTVRVLLIRPALGQLRAARRARELAPALARIREKHRGDRVRMGQEVQKLHAENGTSPFGAILPALLQVPVFLSLYWVLRDFTPTAQSNHVFDRAGVESFLRADLFGARLGNWVSQSAADLAAFATDRAHMLAVGVPLMLLAGAATFLSLRAGQKQQPADNPQFATIGKVMAFLAPAGMLVSGLLFPVPIGVLLYFLANNVWTFGQQHILSTKVDSQSPGGGAPAVVKPRMTTPRPGQKPRRGR